MCGNKNKLQYSYQGIDKMQSLGSKNSSFKYLRGKIVANKC
jgi:hypothetical protein